MSKKLNVIDQYLKILNGDENITYYHAHHDKSNDSVKIVTVYDEGRNYRIKYTINGDVIINRKYPSINTITRMISEIQPEPYG
jgi:hypothetical protein